MWKMGPSIILNQSTQWFELHVHAEVYTITFSIFTVKSANGLVYFSMYVINMSYIYIWLKCFLHMEVENIIK